MREQYFNTSYLGHRDLLNTGVLDQPGQYIESLSLKKKRKLLALKSISVNIKDNLISLGLLNLLSCLTPVYSIYYRIHNTLYFRSTGYQVFVNTS